MGVEAKYNELRRGEMRERGNLGCIKRAARTPERYRPIGRRTPRTEARRVVDNIMARGADGPRSPSILISPVSLI